MTDPKPAPKPGDPEMPTLMAAGDAEKAIPAPAAEPKKPRRWKKILAWSGGILAGVLLLVLLLGPIIIGPIVKSRAVSMLNAMLNGAVTLDEFSFGWGGHVVVGGLTVKDPEGRVVASVKRVDIHTSLLGAISGSYKADVVIDEPVLVARQGPDGKLNLETLMKPEEPRPDREKGPAREKRDEKLPSVTATVAVKNGRISFVAADGRETEFTGVTAKVSVDSLDKPVVFEALLQGAGSISAKGQITIAKDGRLDIEHLHGPVELDLNNVHLSKLLPAVAAYAPVTNLEGTVNGKLPATLTSMTSANVGGGLEIRGFSIASPKLPEPVALDRIRLTPDVTMDSTGTGTEKARLEVGDFVVVTVDAKTENILGEKGKATASITVDGNIKGIADAAGAILKLKQDYTFEGKVKAKADVVADVGKEGPGKIGAVVSASVDEFVAKDGQGRAMPVDRTATLDLKAEYDPAGLVKIERCDARAGTIVVSANGGVDLNARSFSDSVLKIDADLDDVARKAATFMDLGFTFGGKVHVDAKVEGTGDVARAVSTINVSQLRVVGFQGKDIGPIDLTLNQTGLVDLRPGGRSTLESFKLVSGLIDIDAKGEATDALDPEKVAGSASFTVKAYPAAVNAKLGAILAGYMLAGSDLVTSGEAAFRGKDVTLKGDFKAPDLAVKGPALGGKDAVIKDLVVVFSIAANGATLDADVRDVTAQCSSVDAMGVSVKDLLAKVAGSRTGDTIDLRSLELKSSVAVGGGTARITNFNKEGMAATGKFDFRGDIAPIVEIVKTRMPDLKDAKTSGTWALLATAETRGRDIDITPKLTVRRMSLSGYKDLTVQDADITFDAKARVNMDDGGKASIESATLTAPGADVKASGTAAGFSGDLAKLAASVRVDANLQPEELTRRLSAFLFGYKLAGSPVTAGVDVRVEGTERYVLKGKAVAPTVRITMPAADPKAEPRVITQENLAVDFDVTADLKKGSELIDIRTCTYESRTAKASAAGKVTGLEKMTADVVVTADAELARVIADVGAVFGLKDYDVKGTASAKFTVTGDAGKLKASGGATVEKFAVSVPGMKPGEKVTVTDPKISMTADADITTESMDILLHKAGVTCGFLNGTMTGSILKATTDRELKGIEGKFVYVPDKLGAVIQPWLMGGKLSGAEEQTVSFKLDGRAAEVDPLAILRQSSGTMALQIGQFTMTGLAAKGGMDVKLGDQHARTATQLAVNGGTTDLNVDLDLRRKEGAESRATFQLKQVGANAQMAPLLKLLHPVFAVAENNLDGMIDGKIDCRLDLSYTSPLMMGMLRNGWDQFPKEYIHGSGHFEITGLKLNAAGFIKELLVALELGDSREIEVNALDFTIKDGRLRYARPMKMKLAGQLTTWEGTIGLDQTLDLKWNIPITEKLVKKYGFLKYWLGKELPVTVKGTATAPKILWAEFIADMTSKAAEKAIEEKGADLLEGLLGDKEAKKLLEQADQLYDAGKKKEAAAIYREIHEKYKKTRTYEKNKDRIKARENE